jgi:hypothetical protein
MKVMARSVLEHLLIFVKVSVELHRVPRTLWKGARIREPSSTAM